MTAPLGQTVPLPKDALLVELRADRLTLETRECLLSGTVVAFNLLLEGRPMPLHVPVHECLVTDRDRLGYVYQLRLALEELPEPDRQIIALFISKGRGAPQVAPLAPQK